MIEFLLKTFNNTLSITLDFYQKPSERWMLAENSRIEKIKSVTQSETRRGR
jgi:hypothetical protein